MAKIEKGTKVSEKVIAVLKKEFAYEIYGSKTVLKKGQRFACGKRDGHRIDNKNNLVLEHYFGYGAHEMIPAGDFDIFIEETVTVTTKKVTKKPAIIKGKYIVPADEAAE